MAASEAFASELGMTLKFFKNTVSTFGEEDAGFAPKPELYTVAAHIAHVGDTVDWFVEGAFGEGWDMEFDALIARAKAVTTIAKATASVERAFANVTKAIGAASDAELFEPIVDKRIMEGAPRCAIVNAITDHTAHHRGALSVYARLVGKEPAMPYT